MTRKSKRLIVYLIIGIVAIAGIVIGLVWYAMGSALYEPGMAKLSLKGFVLPPVNQPAPDSGFWRMDANTLVAFFTQGTGEHVLIIHGGPGYPIRHPWPGLDSAAATHQFYYYDQRGCGKSTKPFDRFTSTNYYENMMQLDRRLGLATQLADIERIRAILGDEKITLVGHSYGGLLATLYAAEFPDRVKSLVLVAPADLLVMPSEDGGLFEIVKSKLPVEMLAEYDAYMTRYFEFGDIFSRSEQDLASLLAEFGRYYNAAAKASGFNIPRQSAINENGGWMTYAQYFGLGKRHDYRDAVKKVTAPVLVIHGKQDLQREEASRAFSAAFANSKFTVIEGAGHFPQYEKPAEFAKIVGEFLSAT